MQLPEKTDLLVVLGPTASGKTKLATQLSRMFNGEIISADSRQVFRGMDIGTGKDLAEYEEIRHHLIDVVDPEEEFNLFLYQRLAYEAIDTIRSHSHLPVICGGTGLYLEAVLRDYRLIEVPENPELRAVLSDQPDEVLQQRLLALKPQLHNTTDLIDRDRLVRAIEIAEGELTDQNNIEPAPSITPLIVGIDWPREVLRQRINLRLRQRIDEGMIEEVERLVNMGVSHDRLHYFGLEYRFVAEHLAGTLNRNDMIQKLHSAICNFAKRQGNWFRRMEKRGTTIHWLDGKDPMASFELLLKEIEIGAPNGANTE